MIRRTLRGGAATRRRLRLAAIAAALTLCTGDEPVRLFAGGAGWALQFDGVNDHVMLTGVADGTPEATVELWIQPLNVVDGMGETVVQYSSQSAIIDHRVAEGGANFLSLDYSGARVEFRNTGSYLFETPSVKPRTTQKLFHMAYVRNRTHVRMYYNGELAGEQRLLADPTPPPAELLPMLLGARYQYVGGQWVSDDRCFGGIIDELRWWSTARTQAQIQRYMWQPPDGDASGGSVDRWSFDVAGRARDGATFSLGTGDAEKSPAYVPSPVPGVGGPVAVAAKVGAGAVQVRLCALLSNRGPGANFTATFLRAAALGVLAPEPGTPIPLTSAASDGSGRFCGFVNYTSTQVGAELVPFLVVASLPGGVQLQAWQNLSTMATANHHPAAGNARAVRFDGLTGYASLGSFDFPDPDELSIGLFVKPHSMYKGAQLISRHLADGTNLFSVEYNDPFLRVSLWCVVGCFAPYTAYFGAPVEAEGQPVLLTNKTPAQIREAGAQASHVLVTVRCLFRGNESTPAAAVVTVYLNGETIGQTDTFPACWNDVRNRSDQDLTVLPASQAALAPWELGEEYDPGTMGQHLPGLSAVPSQWLSGTFDRVVFWSRELSPDEAAEAALGGVPGEPDVVARYDFDDDDPDECQSRQLWDTSAECLPLNDAAGRIRPPVAFPWTNSIIGGGRFVLSPFSQIRGSEMHVTMADDTCANATLQASDPDGDRVTYRLQAPADGAVLVGDRLQFCATGSEGRRNVTFHFDACDYALCASGLAGLGGITFHVLAPGPTIVAFQALNETVQLRLVFDVATTAPTLDTGAAVARLLSFSHPWGSRVVLGSWEAGGRALRLVLLPGAWPPPAGLTAAVRQSGGLRDAAETSFPSTSTSAAVVFVVCPVGEVLLPSEPNCTGCRGNSVPVKEDGELVCSPCADGLVAAGLECARCPVGSYRAPEDADCKPCPTGFTTVFQAATALEQCVCAEGSYRALAPSNCTGDRPTCQTIVRSGDNCLPCPNGMVCAVGSDMINFLVQRGEANTTLNDLGPYPQLLPRYWSDPDNPLSVYRCRNDLLCPGGDPGTCANGETTGLSCASCAPHHYATSKGCAPCRGTDAAPMIAAFVAAALFAGLLASVAATDTDGARFSLITVAMTAGQLVWNVQMMGVFKGFKVVWMEPLASFMDFASLVAFNVHLLKPDCFLGKDSPIFVFLIRLLCLPVVAMLLAVMMLAVAWRQGKRCFDLDRFHNVLGLLFVMTYVSITVSMVDPLQCIKHPNGKSAMASNLAVLCWETPEHRALVAMSIVGFLCYPVAMLSRVALVTIRYASTVASGGGSQLLKRFRFLFARFRPECHFWGFWYLSRNLLVPLVPVVVPNDSLWQIFLTGVFLQICAYFQASLQPWRIPMANYSEISSIVGLLLFIQTASFLSDVASNTDPTEVSKLMFVILSATLAVALGVFVCSIFRYFCPGMRYHMFLSHHKQGAGSLARWFKLQLNSMSFNMHVFLDSDELDNLDLIVEIVRSRTNNLLVLLTKMTLTRVWCAAEIAAAKAFKVRLVLVTCCDYDPPDQEFFDHLDVLWTKTEQQVLVQYGVPMEHVREAYKYLNTLDSIRLQRFAPIDVQLDAVRAAVKGCESGQSSLRLSSMKRNASTGLLVAMWSPGSHSVDNFSSRTTQGVVRIVILGASGDAEARSTCEVLRLLVETKTGTAACAVFTVRQAEALWPRADSLLVVLTRGLLHDPGFAEVGESYMDWLKGRSRSIHITVALADSNFPFPSPDYYNAVEEKAPTQAAFLRRVFNVLALPFSPHSGFRILAVQVEELCTRMANHVRMSAKDMEADSSMAVKEATHADVDVEEIFTL